MFRTLTLAVVLLAVCSTVHAGPLSFDGLGTFEGRAMYAPSGTDLGAGFAVQAFALAGHSCWADFMASTGDKPLFFGASVSVSGAGTDSGWRVGCRLGADKTIYLSKAVGFAIGK